MSFMPLYELLWGYMTDLHVYRASVICMIAEQSRCGDVYRAAF